MTGIEHLREFVRTFHGCPSDVCRYTLTSIADQIAREQADRSDKIAESFRSEVFEAYEWVREHGGLGALQVRVDMLRDTLDWLRKRAGVGKDELADYNELLDAIDRRLMPEGCEWPRYDTGEPVCIGSEILTTDGQVRCEHFALTITDDDGGVTTIDFGERVRRPEPKVLDADGAEIRVGDTVWHVHDLDKFTVTNSNNGENLSVSCLPERSHPPRPRHRCGRQAAARGGDGVVRADSQ